MPVVGTHDAFEFAYRASLKARLAPHGLLVEYPEDRAALDLGLHLYGEADRGGNRRMSNVRVWFQCKGMRSASLTAADISRLEAVSVGGLPLDQVMFWYGSPEPVYLCVYLEATDAFIAQDVRDLIDEIGGMPELMRRRRSEQETMTLRVRTDATLDAAFHSMPQHRSMRIDGPSFRGRPLGHRYDPLRSELAPMEPADFDAVVDGLLGAHEFKPDRDVPLRAALGDAVGDLSARVGTLCLTYEWINPMETEFGWGPDAHFRAEGPPHHAQGEVLAVVHSRATAAPSGNDASRAIAEELVRQGVGRALVFINAPQSDPRIWSAWRFALQPLVSVPQSLGSLTFNILTTTCVYLDNLEHLEWRFVNYL